MADERINTLGDAPADLSGYNFIMDKTGIGEALKASYETILAKMVAASVPTVSSFSLSVSVGSLTATTMSKKAIIGKSVAFQIVFTYTSPSTTESYFNLIGLTSIAGVTNQGLNCEAVIDNPSGEDPVQIFNCHVIDDDPFTIRLTPETGTLVADTDFIFRIHGTLITT